MDAEVKEIYLMPLLKLKNEPALALGTFYPSVPYLKSDSGYYFSTFL